MRNINLGIQKFTKQEPISFTTAAVPIIYTFHLTFLLLNKYIIHTELKLNCPTLGFNFATPVWEF